MIVQFFVVSVVKEYVIIVDKSLNFWRMNRIMQPHSRVIPPVPSIGTSTCFSVSRVEQIFLITFVSIECRSLRITGTPLPLFCKPSWREQGLSTHYFCCCVRITNSGYYITYIFFYQGLLFNTSMKHPPQDTILSRFHPFILTVFFLPCISYCFCSDFLLNFSIYSLSPLKRKFKLTDKPHTHKI